MSSNESRCVVSSYRDSIINSLYQLQRKNCFCDVEITTNSGTVYVHKVILAICESPALHESVNVADKVSFFGKTNINCSDYSQEVVESLVRYLYTGEITVEERNVKAFTKLCQSFQLDKAVDAFVSHMIQQNILNSARQDGHQLSVSIGTCDNLSTLSDAADMVSSGTSLDLSMKSNKSFTTLKKSECEEKELKIEHTGNEKPCDQSMQDSPPCFDDDEDENTVDLTEYDTLIKNKGPKQQAIIKVDNQEGFDPKVNISQSKTNAKGNVNMFLMSPEHNPYYEAPDTRTKRSRRRISQSASDGATDKPTSKRKSKPTTRSRNKSSPKTGLKAKKKTSKKGNLKIKIKKSKIQVVEQDENEHNEEISDDNVTETTEDNKKPKRKRGVVHRWCRKCDVRFPEKDLRKHLRTKHPPYSCKMCEWTGLLKRELALHMYSKHQMLIMPDKYPLLQCDNTGCTFKTLFSYALDRHKECHNRLVRHLCDVCGSSFATAGGLKEHSLRHADENPIYKCDICDAVFGWKCKLKSHEMKEHGTYLLCEICTYRTKYKDKLTMHLHHEHGQPLPPNQKIHRCDQCDFYCINRSKLRFHKIRHSGEKNHTCGQCGKSYLNQHQLKNHINSTHGARTFDCHLCSYVSKRKSELNNHIKSRHSEDRPFTCNLCDYACKLRGNLHKHIRLVHKVDVVTRNQLHQNMLQTGKGYMDLLNARKTDEIVIQEKEESSKPKETPKPSTEPSPRLIISEEPNQNRQFQQVIEPQIVDDGMVRRNIEMLIRTNEGLINRNPENFTAPIAGSVPIVGNVYQPVNMTNNGNFQPPGTHGFS
ncbi:uncharacterized protein LOC143075721 [Mytilus galloprovincialis]|uniref:uncharacterized protein LOC143075721 n=1 Tax=Mytilus galloprovincialis TaxID=29158 RepID=UPI003F7B747C